MVIEPSKPDSFPDIAAEAPGVLTEREEVFGVDEVVQEGTTQSNHKGARLAAENQDWISPQCFERKSTTKIILLRYLKTKKMKH
jgi:hypothetical protein